MDSQLPVADFGAGPPLNKSRGSGIKKDGTITIVNAMSHKLVFLCISSAEL